MSEKELSFKIDWTPEQKKAFKDITGFTELDEDYIKIEQLLNLIEKQQKEIEELKRKYMPTPEHPVPIELQTTVFVDKRDYISKDKIREKIKELEKDENFYREQSRMYEYEGKMNMLEELLGEEYE